MACIFVELRLQIINVYLLTFLISHCVMEANQGHSTLLRYAFHLRVPSFCSIDSILLILNCEVLYFDQILVLLSEQLKDNK